MIEPTGLDELGNCRRTDVSTRFAGHPLSATRALKGLLNNRADSARYCECNLSSRQRGNHASPNERQNLSMTFESKPPAPVDNERNRSKFFGATAALVYAAGAAFDRSRIRARIIERHH